MAESHRLSIDGVSVCLSRVFSHLVADLESGSGCLRLQQPLGSIPVDLSKLGGSSVAQRGF